MKTFTLIISILLAFPVNAQIINVPDDYPTVQQGIIAAQPGDTVLVAHGIYYEQINFLGKAITVASNYIMDANPLHITSTILDGGSLPAGSASVVHFISGEDTTSILNGFTIRNGKGTYTVTAIAPYIKGGGINIYNSGAKIINNRIINNILDGVTLNACPTGAAICAHWPSTDNWVVVVNNTIQNNQSTSTNYDAGGAVIYSCYNTRLENNTLINNTSICNGNGKAYAEVCGLSYPDPGNWFIVKNNIIHDNTSDGLYGCMGAGVWSYQINTVISGNIISNNESISDTPGGVRGAGICLENPVSVLIKGNEISNNITAGSGGGIAISTNNDAEVLIEDNVFKLNEANKGGAIYSHSAQLFIRNNAFQLNEANFSYGGALYMYRTGTPITTARVVNNSFSENSALISGGAVYSFGCNPEFLNNIFWMDSAEAGSEIFVPYGTGYIAYSNIDTTKIEGEIDILEGVFTEDPIFCATQCLMPESWSLCIDQGIGQFIFPGMDTLNAPLTDIMGTIRPLDAGFDVGAYEIKYSGIGINEVENNLDVSIYPNPFTNRLYCEYHVEDKSNVKITLYDLLGRVQTTWQQVQVAGEYNTPIEFGMLHRGIYLLEFRINDATITKKIIKHNPK